MILIQAAERVFSKIIEIESMSLQTLLVNLMMKKMSNFIKHYWLIIILTNILIQPHSILLKNVLNGTKIRTNTQLLKGFNFNINIPFIKNLNIQISIKAQNNRSYKFVKEINQIIMVLKQNYIFNSNYMAIRKK